MNREQIRKAHKKFESKVKAELHGTECAMALFLKERGVVLELFDPQDQASELIFNLATSPEFYAIMRLAVQETENEEGDKLYSKAIVDNKLNNDVKDK